MSDDPVELEWLAEGHFRVGGTEFVDVWGPGSTAERFHIRKNRPLVEAYIEALRPHTGATIVELGIADGGSVALMELVASPRRLVALELEPVPVQALTDLIDRRGIADRVRPHYGIDQSDRDRVLEVVTRDLEGASLDLVIDDASHLLEPTRASFETLFPLLRPGGRYLIEDWCWQSLFGEQLRAAVADDGGQGRAFEANLRAQLEQPDSPVHEQFRRAVAALQDDPDPEVRARIARQMGVPPETQDGSAPVPADGGRPAPPLGPDHASPTVDETSPLPALAIDLMMARATSGEVVADVHIDGFFISITRGPAALDPERFRLADTFVDHWGIRWG